jgi:hypothetical protein
VLDRAATETRIDELVGRYMAARSDAAAGVTSRGN